MKNPTGNWKITEAHQKEVYAFILDFWKLIKATYEIDGEPSSWDTFVKWVDALMKKHDNPICQDIAMAYLKAIDQREVEEERRGA